MGDASTDLLVIATPSGRYKMKVQVTFSTLSLLMEELHRMDANVMKNMDDICFFADSLLVLEKNIYEFLKFCQRKNLKLKTSRI